MLHPVDDQIVEGVAVPVGIFRMVLFGISGWTFALLPNVIKKGIEMMMVWNNFMCRQDEPCQERDDGTDMFFSDLQSKKKLLRANI